MSTHRHVGPRRTIITVDGSFEVHAAATLTHRIAEERSYAQRLAIGARARCIAALYALLMRCVRLRHRGRMPNDDEYEYQLECVAAYAASIWRRVLAGAFALFALFVLYAYVDATFLHWNLNVTLVPPRMSNRTVAARAALGEADLLTLFGNESEQSSPRAVLFAQTSIEMQTVCDWRALVDYATRYLAANRGRELCCCAPMFGMDVNHLAWEASREETGGTQAVVVHLFNLHDSLYERYDGLDLSAASVNQSELGRFAVVRHSQAHLFAWPPQPDAVAVLRRTSVRVRAMTALGTSMLVDVENERAYCLAECYDLFNGVSVYERARRQAAGGIKI